LKLFYKPYTLYFKRPFKIAHGTRSSTPIVIVQLEYEGLFAYGEASMPPYLGESHESVIMFLNKASGILKNLKYPFDLETILKEIDALAPNNTAAKASIDIALNDLIGKIENKPCWQLYGANKMDTPYTTYTLGIDEPEMMKQKIDEGNAYTILKVKLNGEKDKACINTIRSITDKPIAIDVNQGWKNKEEALEMINWLKDKNVLLIEQALPKNNWDDAHWLFERSSLPLYADESIQRLSDIDKVKDCFDGINIKLMKCTGMHEAFKMIQRARELNLKILMGCMSETSCAISAAAQLTPFTDYADLDGPLLIKNDLFKGITFEKGKITLNDMPGIGLFQEILEE
jgi:L-alanine-DL-glutamate epimerase-like enolase superfamily enzyme